MEQAPPPPPPPRFYTHAEAYEAMAREPQIHQIYIDGKRTSLLDLYKRLAHGPYDFQDIHVRHPGVWSISLFRQSPESTHWYLDQSPSLAHYGVLTRSYATQQYTIPNDELYDIWTLLTGYFPDIERDLQLRQVAAHRNTQLRSRAAERFILNRGGPENLGIEAASYIEGPRRRGWAEGLRNLERISPNLFNNTVNMPRHLKKINTTLFSNGGKRKQRSKTRRQRKH